MKRRLNSTAYDSTASSSPRPKKIPRLLAPEGYGLACDDAWHIVASVLHPRDRLALKLVCKQSALRDARFTIFVPAFLRQTTIGRVKCAVQHYMYQRLHEVRGIEKADVSIKFRGGDDDPPIIKITVFPDLSPFTEPGYVGPMNIFKKRAWGLTLVHDGTMNGGGGWRTHSYRDRAIFRAGTPNDGDLGRLTAHDINQLLSQVVSEYRRFSTVTLQDAYRNLARSLHYTWAIDYSWGTGHWSPSADHPIHILYHEREQFNIWLDELATASTEALRRDAQLNLQRFAEYDVLCDRIHQLETEDTEALRAWTEDLAARIAQDAIYSRLRKHGRESSYYHLVHIRGIRTLDALQRELPELFLRID